jgi:hypothetical protein
VLNFDELDVAPHHARRIVICAGGFWACWGASVLFASNLSAIFVLCGLVLGFGLYATTGDMLSGETGLTGVELMFSFSWDRSIRRAKWRSVLMLLSLRWWRRVLSATGWPRALTASAMVALLASDLVLTILVWPNSGH